MWKNKEFHLELDHIYFTASVLLILENEVVLPYFCNTPRTYKECPHIFFSYVKNIQYVPANSQPKISKLYIFTCLGHETYKLGQYYLK